MISLITNLLIKRPMKRWLKCMESELAEEFLQALLNLMSFAFLINHKKFRSNIKGFNGRYLFRSMDDQITIAAIFKKNKLKVVEKKIDQADIVVTFRNSKVLMNYILSPKVDILGSILRQDVTFNGNLNYIYKFAYLSKRLQLMAMGQI